MQLTSTQNNALQNGNINGIMEKGRGGVVGTQTQRHKLEH